MRRIAAAVPALFAFGNMVFAQPVPLRITEVNPATGSVEVTNVSTDPFSNPSPLPFSHRLDESSSIPAATAFASGESKLFTVTGLDATDSDLWLYADTNFTDPASIVTGLKYGPAADVGRTAIAVAAGIWPSTNDYAPSAGAGESLRLISFNPTNPADWVSGTPSPGAFFGTGTPIDDPIPTPIPASDVIIELAPVASGMAAPLGLLEANDGTGRLLIYDQTGVVVVVVGGQPQPTPFLDVTSRLVPLMTQYDERGLLGLALHPNFASNGKLYTFTTEPPGSGVADFTTAQPAEGFSHQNVIAEWTVDQVNPNTVNAASRRELVRIDHPAFNHDGGTLRFGADGMLYFSIGDGGNGDDEGEGHAPEGNAQRTDNIYGKILRINPDGNNSPNGQYGIPVDNPFAAGPGLDEIYAYGLRNPYAFSFDMANNAMWVGDAGQNKIEEIDIVTAGANCGWRLKEGTFFFDPNGPAAGFVTTIPVAPIPTGLLEPIAEYDHDEGTVVVGGFVYRSSEIPALNGHYITGDFSDGFAPPAGRLFHVAEGNQLRELQIGVPARPFALYLKGFGQDLAGNVYVCASQELAPSGTGGMVFRIVAVNAANADLTVAKTASAASVAVGDQFNFTIQVANSGPDTLNGVAMTDQLPVGIELLSSSTTRGTVGALGGTVTAQIGDLAAGETATVELTVRALAAGQYTNTAGVTAIQQDQNPGNNSSSAAVTVTGSAGGPDLTGTWTVIPVQTCTTARRGTNCTLRGTLQVTNQGDATARRSTIRYYLSNDTVFDASDTFLRKASTGTVRAGVSKIRQFRKRLPLDVTASGRFVLAVIDATGRVTESIEDNNTVPAAIP